MKTQEGVVQVFESSIRIPNPIPYIGLLRGQFQERETFFVNRQGMTELSFAKVNIGQIAIEHRHFWRQFNGFEKKTERLVWQAQSLIQKPDFVPEIGLIHRTAHPWLSDWIS
ncbi:MAG: hypothetical protein N2049_11080 [Anaerolineales bacterium]|nr:hypothetical protein [Anaerolineales bacterium]MCX7609740.1 hypothetical protein [Anaerolineales bacterium]